MPAIAPLIIGGATLGAAAIGSSAAKSAASTQASAANQATALQQNIFDQTKAGLAPFTAYGKTATTGLSKLLGLDGSTPAPPQVGDQNYGAWLKANPDVVNYYNSTPDASTSFPNINDFAKTVAQQQGGIRSAVPTYNAQDVADYRSPTSQYLETLPGYQFAKQQGIATVNRTLGSTGQTGAQAKGIARFVTGLADSTYNGQVKNLADAANLGESAAAGVGTIGANTGANIAGTTVGAGTALASGTVGAANAATGAINNGVNAFLTNSILNPKSPAGGGIYAPAGDAAANIAGVY